MPASAWQKSADEVFASGLLAQELEEHEPDTVVRPRCIEIGPVVHERLKNVAAHMGRRVTTRWTRVSAPMPAVHSSPYLPCSVVRFFFNDTATTEIYTLSPPFALPFFFKEPASARHSPSSLARRLPL